MQRTNAFGRVKYKRQKTRTLKSNIDTFSIFDIADCWYSNHCLVIATFKQSEREQQKDSEIERKNKKKSKKEIVFHFFDFESNRVKIKYSNC